MVLVHRLDRQLVLEDCKYAYVTENENVIYERKGRDNEEPLASPQRPRREEISEQPLKEDPLERLRRAYASLRQHEAVCGGIPKAKLLADPCGGFDVHDEQAQQVPI